MWHRIRDLGPCQIAACPVHAHLRATGAPVAVVYRGGCLVGLVTAATLFDQAVSSRSDAPLIAVMDYITVPVARYTDANAALRAINCSR